MLSDISKRYVLPLTMVRSGASTAPDPVSIKYLYVSIGAVSNVPLPPLVKLITSPCWKGPLAIVARS